VTVVLPDSVLPVAYGRAGASCRSEGLPVPTMDLLIGVTAAMHGVPLLTRDRSHFQRIPELVVETY